MRSAEFQDGDWEDYDAPARPSADDHPVARTEPVIFPIQGARWSESRGRINWPAAAVAIGLNALLLTAMVTLDVVHVSFARPTATVVTLLELPRDPPSVPPPDVKVERIEEPRPMVVAPPPIVQTPQLLETPVPVNTAVEPAPVRAAVVAPSLPGPTGPVSVANLDSKMVSAKPPKYPVESRRKHEQGTVILSVLLSTVGAVADVSVSKSSGFARLDKAALDAVRRWQWSPTVMNGQAVMVKGIVEIPFVLTT